MSAVTESVRIETRGDIALLIIDNPPVNALSHHVRQGILDGISQAESSDARAIVLICDGRTFIAGADITEFGGPPKPPSLQAAQTVMENCTKPVIAAIHGTALGGGLEMALCAHYRVAVASAKLGLPEVKLGLLPGAGGTQRLPRIVGPGKALEMIAGGNPISAEDALASGLVDEIVEDLEADAVAFAQRVVSDGRPLPKVRDLQEKVEDVDPALFADFRRSIARRSRGFLAPELTIQCVEAAVTLDFDAGLARERELFIELIGGSQSRAQQYYFFAERSAAKIPDIARDTPLLDISTCGVLGAGTMGGGIAMTFVNAGIPVTLVERDQDSLDRGLAVIRKNYDRSVSRGRITAADAEARMSLLTGSLDRNDFAPCDIVVEAVFENMDLKKSVFADLDRICKPGAVLATNTSALDVNEIAAATTRPESVIGMHFFSPANVMKLLEVVRGAATSDSVVATVMNLAKRIGKIATLVGVCNGFVGNRMLFMRRLEANRIILEGATPNQVDAVLYEFGFPMGPFAMSDLAGLDIGWSADTSKSETLQELMCESGRRGQKNGRGYYLYDPQTRASTPDPEVEDMIRAYATVRGIAQREVTESEILERCLYPMVNEAAKILDERIAIRGSDIDVVWVNGYGWPVYTGGPMFWADTLGLEQILDGVERYHADLGGPHWEPSALLQRLVAEGADLHSYINA